MYNTVTSRLDVANVKRSTMASENTRGTSNSNSIQIDLKMSAVTSVYDKTTSPRFPTVALRPPRARGLITSQSTTQSSEVLSNGRQCGALSRCVFYGRPKNKCYKLN